MVPSPHRPRPAFGTQAQRHPARRRLPALFLAALGEALPLDLRQHQHRRLGTLQPGHQRLRWKLLPHAMFRSRGAQADEAGDRHSGSLGPLAHALPLRIGHHDRVGKAERVGILPWTLHRYIPLSHSILEMTECDFKPPWNTHVTDDVARHVLQRFVSTTHPSIPTMTDRHSA